MWKLSDKLNPKSITGHLMVSTLCFKCLVETDSSKAQSAASKVMESHMDEDALHPYKTHTKCSKLAPKRRFTTSECSYKKETMLALLLHICNELVIVFIGCKRRYFFGLLCSTSVQTHPVSCRCPLHLAGQSC